MTRRPVTLAAVGLIAWQLVPIAAEAHRPALAGLLFVAAAVAIGGAICAALAVLESR